MDCIYTCTRMYNIWTFSVIRKLTVLVVLQQVLQNHGDIFRDNVVPGTSPLSQYHRETIPPRSSRAVVTIPVAIAGTVVPVRLVQGERRYPRQNGDVERVQRLTHRHEMVSAPNRWETGDYPRHGKLTNKLPTARAFAHIYRYSGRIYDIHVILCTTIYIRVRVCSTYVHIVQSIARRMFARCTHSQRLGFGRTAVIRIRVGIGVSLRMRVRTGTSVIIQILENKIWRAFHAYRMHKCVYVHTITLYMHTYKIFPESSE